MYSYTFDPCVCHRSRVCVGDVAILKQCVVFSNISALLVVIGSFVPIAQRHLLTIYLNSKRILLLVDEVLVSACTQPRFY